MLDIQVQYEEEWQQFKSDTELKISANQKNIDDFKLAIKKTSKKFRVKYENQVLTLEQKNIELKKKLNDYKYAGKETWESFKVEFYSDIDSIDAAIKSLFERKE